MLLTPAEIVAAFSDPAKPLRWGVDGWLARFRRNIVPEPNSGCHLWAGGAHPSGYGVFGTLPALAHRVSWALAHGRLPGSLFVLHKCDTPCCVNPNHLFLGTNADNMRDMGAKHRSATQRHPEITRGERNNAAKLNAEQVRQIRARAASGERQDDLAREYGVRQAAISHIVVRRNWRHIP